LPYKLINSTNRIQMDIFAHGLWTGALYKTLNKKVGKPLKVWPAIFWGTFPDLFAFAPAFIWLSWNLFLGSTNISDLPRPEEIEPTTRNITPIFRLTSLLYNISHSAIIFLIIFGIVFLIFRRPVWELGGWFIHIVIDIPTHSYRFFPTPFLWPLSEWKISGFPWANPFFLIPNYIAIIIVYFLLRKNKKSKSG